jgi:hypothetical protein
VNLSVQIRPQGGSWKSGPSIVTGIWLKAIFCFCKYKLKKTSSSSERGESRAKAQHAILIKSFEKVTRDTDGENEVWKIKLLIFVGGTSGSVNVKTFNKNMHELQVIESKRNAIRKGLAFELLNAKSK